MPTEAGIEPRTVATGALTVRRSDRKAKSHPRMRFSLAVSLLPLRNRAIKKHSLKIRHCCHRGPVFVAGGIDSAEYLPNSMYVSDPISS